MKPCLSIDPITGAATIAKPMEMPKCIDCKTPLSRAFCERAASFGQRHPARCASCRAKTGHKTRRKA